MTIAGTLTQNSDARLKADILPLETTLEKIEQIGAYQYHWKGMENKGSAKQIGLLAQEVEAQFPELVHHDSQGLKSVAYTEMVAVLLQAIKEMKAEINVLRATINNK